MTKQCGPVGRSSLTPYLDSSYTEIVNVEAKKLLREIPIKSFSHNTLIKFKISFMKSKKGREAAHIHDTNWQVEFLWLDMYLHVKTDITFVMLNHYFVQSYSVLGYRFHCKAPYVEYSW